MSTPGAACAALRFVGACATCPVCRAASLAWPRGRACPACAAIHAATNLPFTPQRTARSLYQHLPRASFPCSLVSPALLWSRQHALLSCLREREGPTPNKHCHKGEHPPRHRANGLGFSLWWRLCLTRRTADSRRLCGAALDCQVLLPTYTSQQPHMACKSLTCQLSVPLHAVVLHSFHLNSVLPHLPSTCALHKCTVCVAPRCAPAALRPTLCSGPLHRQQVPGALSFSTALTARQQPPFMARHLPPAAAIHTLSLFPLASGRKPNERDILSHLPFPRRAAALID